MRLLLILAMVILFSGGSAFANTDKIDSELSTLETRFFSQTYPSNTVSQRLDRLDQLVFGRVRHGSTETRMSSLLMTIPNAQAPTTPSQPANNAPEISVPLKPEEPVDASVPQTPPQIAPQQAPQPEADTSTDYYPTVTALEHQITGTTDQSLPVEQRLARLETVAFGKPSTLTDLSKRVDLLKQYARTKYGGKENYLTSSNAVGLPQDSSGLEGEVSSMEQEVFGKTYAKDTLNSRVDRLEKNVLPKHEVQTFTPITQRISQLMSVLSTSGTRAAGAPAAGPITYQGTSAPTQYPESGSYGMNPSQQNMISTAQKPKPKHSLFHKFGVALEDVGGMAARNMMYGGFGGMGGF